MSIQGDRSTKPTEYLSGTPWPPHWASMSVTQTERNLFSHPKFAKRLPRHHLSIFMGDSPGRKVGAIRLVIVQSEDEDVVVTLVNNDAIGTFSRRSAASIGARHTPKAHEEAVTVVFRMTLANPDEDYHRDFHTCFCLVPLNQRADSVPKPLRIIYDRMYSVSTGSNAVTTTLVADHLHKPSWGSASAYYELYYSIRLLPFLPAQESQQPVGDLPSNIMLHIFDYVFSDGPFKSWPARLFAFALLRKSWLPILRLFWVRLGSKGWITRVHSYEPVIRALGYVHQPDWAKEILGFDFDDLNHYRSSEEHVLFSVAFLGMTKHLKRLTVPSHVFHMARVSIHDMISLENVEIDSLEFSRGTPASIGEIQHALSRCRNLFRLYVVMWDSYVRRRKRSSAVKSPLGPVEPTPAYALKELSLINEIIDGTQLLLFVSGPCQRLETLYLYNVHGLTNDDLWSFFEVPGTCSVLNHLKIAQCKVLPSSPAHAKERAFDHFVEQMPNLGIATLSPDLVSSLAISRKKRVLKEDGVMFTTLEIWGYEKDNDMGEAWKALIGVDVDSRSLADAIQVSQWARIELVCRTQLPQCCLPALDAAMEVAHQRGISFTTR